jgi:hypothetical protein
MTAWAPRLHDFEEVATTASAEAGADARMVRPTNVPTMRLFLSNYYLPVWSNDEHASNGPFIPQLAQLPPTPEYLTVV